MVVENVRGAQKWVGRSRWNFGSFHLWGDVPALMPMTKQLAKRPGHDWNRFRQTGEVSPQIARLHDGLKSPGCGAAGWGGGRDVIGRTPSNTKRRRHASAAIAKIPLPLARHVARVYRP